MTFFFAVAQSRRGRAISLNLYSLSQSQAHSNILLKDAPDLLSAVPGHSIPPGVVTCLFFTHTGLSKVNASSHGWLERVSEKYSGHPACASSLVCEVASWDNHPVRAQLLVLKTFFF